MKCMKYKTNIIKITWKSKKKKNVLHNERVRTDIMEEHEL
jgi:hypothetical protein